MCEITLKLSKYGLGFKQEGIDVEQVLKNEKNKSAFHLLDILLNDVSHLIVKDIELFKEKMELPKEYKKMPDIGFELLEIRMSYINTNLVFFIDRQADELDEILEADFLNKIDYYKKNYPEQTMKYMMNPEKHIKDILLIVKKPLQTMMEGERYSCRLAALSEELYVEMKKVEENMRKNKKTYV